MRSRATSVDVAREAGVSRATVSYVLNDTPGQTIPDDTRARVHAAAKRLGYAPSAAARALRKGRSDVILYVFPEWPIGPAMGGLISALTSALAERKLTLLAYQHLPGAAPLHDLWTSVSPAVVILSESPGCDEERSMRAAGIGVLHFVDKDPAKSGLLAASQLAVGAAQAHHLATRGHRRLGYAYPADSRLEAFAVPRLEGLRAACAELGLPEPDVRVVDPEAPSLCVRSWAADGVTGVCAYNDEVAFAVLAGARALGVAVPADLAVIGVDDIPVARHSDPPLTTTVANLEGMAAYMADAVAAVLHGRPAPNDPAGGLVRVIARESG